MSEWVSLWHQYNYRECEFLIFIRIACVWLQAGWLASEIFSHHGAINNTFTIKSPPANQQIKELKDRLDKVKFRYAPQG